MMARNTRRPAGPKVYDRMASDVPINARVVPAVVDDPYGFDGEKITVLRSIRDDPLAEMYSRGQIDHAQYIAGRTWQEYYERAEVGFVKAVDPAREAVDGGQFPDPLPDRRMSASDQIALADRKLGQDGCAIIRDVLWHGMSLTACAQRRGMVRQIDRRNMSVKFKWCLEVLAKLWHHA
ncbi:MAG: hypothetical protein AB7R40_23500 [Nitrospiraceae bacterium]